ncbi:MAG: hypothetical protein IJ862_07060 [Selenomonadaceae bacterium]|nr:hypothetical protein [Selenomonadaceae bacterium]
MKKLFIFTLTAICLLSLNVLAEAASNSKTNQQIAVVIVGGADYRTKDFTSYAKDFFNPGEGMTIAHGKDVQNQYQKYWFDKGLIDEGTPTKEDFVEFVNYSGYKQVIYLVIKDSVLEQHGRTKGKDRSRVSLTVNAFLVDKTHVLEGTSSTNEEDSKTSELRAKRGAFKQCVKEISKVFNPILSK